MRTLEDAFLNTDTSSQMKQTNNHSSGRRRNNGDACSEDYINDDVVGLIRAGSGPGYLGSCRRLRESVSCLHMLEGGTHIHTHNVVMSALLIGYLTLPL